MKNSIKRSLGFKLAAMILLAGMTTGVIYYYFEVHYAEIDFNERARTRINENAHILAIHLWNFDEHVVGLIGNALLVSREVIGVRVLDEEKRVFFEKGLFAGSEVQRVSKEIRYADKSIGQLEIAFSKVLFSAYEKEIIFTSLLVVFAAAFSLFLLLQILLKSAVITPIEKLIKDIAKIGKGDLKHKVKVEYNNEFGELAKAFNQMTEKRRLAEEALQKAHDELEQRVEERTDELSEANEVLKQEIQEHKQTEAALRESEAKFRSLFENMFNGFAYCKILLDENNKPIDFVYLEVNNSFEKLTGLRKEDVVGKKVSVVMPAIKDNNPELFDIYGKVALTGKEAEFNIYFEPLGIWLSISVYSPQKEYFVAIFEDITDRQRAEEALRDSEEKYRTLTENIPDIIYSFDKDGKIITINPQTEELFGYQSKEMIGNHISAFIHPQDKDMYLKTLMEGVKNHQKYMGELEFSIVDKSGATRWVEMHSRNQFDEHGNFLQQDGVLRDITETKLLQDQLIRSERLAATGQLATSIAHEINSPLQGITSLIGVIKESYDKGAELLENIELIEDGFKRIRDTVKKLLDLNRPGKEQKQSININAVINDTLSLVKVLLQKNKIEVDLSLSARVPDILASPQQLAHVFVNLINNAVESMTGDLKGEGWEKRTAAGGEIRINTRLRKEEVIIEVADTGPGISKKDMQNIFDPFYTRKKTMGMGIGLSICHGIIEDHKGSIVAKNLPAGGAVFKITLPVN